MGKLSATTSQAFPILCQNSRLLYSLFLVNEDVSVLSLIEINLLPDWPIITTQHLDSSFILFFSKFSIAG